MYRIVPMSLEFAKGITAWNYAKPYDIYNLRSDDETLYELLDGNYVACLDQKNELVGYFCHGDAARIPTIEAYRYSDDRLDIGLGMRPECCGKGDGEAFVICGLKYMVAKHPDLSIRLTVACFNQRAITVYKRIGFCIHSTVTHAISKQPFYVMLCERTPYRQFRV